MFHSHRLLIHYQQLSTYFLGHTLTLQTTTLLKKDDNKRAVFFIRGLVGILRYTAETSFRHKQAKNVGINSS